MLGPNFVNFDGSLASCPITVAPYSAVFTVFLWYVLLSLHPGVSRSKFWPDAKSGAAFMQNLRNCASPSGLGARFRAPTLFGRATEEKGSWVAISFSICQGKMCGFARLDQRIMASRGGVTQASRFFGYLRRDRRSRDRDGRGQHAQHRQEAPKLAAPVPRACAIARRASPAHATRCGLDVGEDLLHKIPINRKQLRCVIAFID